MENSYVEIGIAIIAVLGGAGAWNFYAKKVELKYREKGDDKKDQNLFRDQILNELQAVKTNLSEKDVMIIELTAEVHTLRERVKNLEAENQRLLRK